MPEGAAASCPAQGPAAGHKEHAKVETGKPPGRWGLPTAEGTGARKGGAQSRGGNLEAGTGPSGTGNAPKNSVEPCAAVGGGGGLGVVRPLGPRSLCPDER